MRDAILERLRRAHGELREEARAYYGTIEVPFGVEGGTAHSLGLGILGGAFDLAIGDTPTMFGGTCVIDEEHTNLRNPGLVDSADEAFIIEALGAHVSRILVEDASGQRAASAAESAILSEQVAVAFADRSSLHFHWSEAEERNTSTLILRTLSLLPGAVALRASASLALADVHLWSRARFDVKLHVEAPVAEPLTPHLAMLRRFAMYWKIRVEGTSLLWARPARGGGA